MKKMTQQEIDEWERELSQRDKTMQNCKLVKLRVKERFRFNPLDVSEDVYPVRIARALEKEKRCQPAPVKPSKTTWITSGIQRLKNHITQIVQNI